MHNMYLISVIFLLFPVFLMCTEEIKYNGYKVLQLFPNSLIQIEYLNNIANNISYAIPLKKIDFWKVPSDINSSVDLMVAPDLLENIQTNLYEQQIKSNIIIEDVGEILEEEKRCIEEASLLYRTKSGPQNESLFFTSYHSLLEIHQFLDDLTTFNKEICSTEVIGTSTESRPLKLIRIGSQRRDDKDIQIDKPIIWIDAGIHAREWIAPMTALFIANKLVRSYNSSPEIKELVDIYDFLILSSSNPDGYEYSRTTDRMWRKTRSYTPSFWGFFCRGVDPNRNWNYHWGSAGSSSHPCSETYHGSTAFSEPETKSISNYLLKIKDNVKMYVTLHSYSQFILTPWGWTKELPTAYSDLLKRAVTGADALKAKYNTIYKVGSSTQMLYAASGGSDDWAHGVCGIKYSYTFELRDTGRYGFVLPKEMIVPTGEETFEAIKVMVQGIADEYELRKSYKNSTNSD